MLRRKTPNGTLAAGYDGTPVQWSSKAPALKHVALDPAGQNETHATSVMHDPRAIRRSATLRQSYGYQQASKTPRFAPTGRDTRTREDRSSWHQFPSNFPQVVCDQIITQHASTFYPNQSMWVPTVLQPAYQPSPGPTASNDGGLYGPYWPDGRFVPYRPAAMRDERGHPQQGMPMNRPYSQQTLPSTERLPPFRSVSIDQETTLLPHLGHPLVNVLGKDVYRPQTLCVSSLPHGSGASFLNVSEESGRPTSHAHSKIGNLHFKEKALSWAHSIYVDLLTFLHRTRKVTKQTRQTIGSRPFSKNSIYPKPPRQPAPFSGLGHWEISDGTETSNLIPQSRDGQASIRSRSSPNLNFGRWQGIGNRNDNRFTGPPNQDMPHYISPLQASPQVVASPLNQARDALEMLTTLCDQSGWIWIDGMLLGGCLAYGLEEYQKALECYSKIIALDPQ